jgi:hypothetical protein
VDYRGQRGIIKAVLPLLVGEHDFFDEVHTAFGGVDALPNMVSVGTMQKVEQHMAEITGDGSTTQLCKLMEEVTGDATPAVVVHSARVQYACKKLWRGAFNGLILATRYLHHNCKAGERI